MKNYYEILDLPVKSSIKKINKSQYNRIRKFRSKRDDKDYDLEAFKLESEAFFVLRNPRRKQIYDQLYSIHFGNRTLKNQKLQKKWEAMIRKVEIAGRDYGQYLTEISDCELRKIQRQDKGRGFFASIMDAFLSGLDFFSFLG
ncbi:J domain-containing protein [Crocinitomix catalasitica]|uniref:hypothetical protein n=1 Tax=Crocinitomix catalasitica TaxID=184607 RepID=UPI000483B7D0|nr:hypothetical protein [Crocinitomix catalasitica]